LLAKNFAKGIGGVVIASETNDGELFRENIFMGEIDQGGDELALGEVPGGAKNDHDTGHGGGSFHVVRGH
jgi:hypothetical protein